MAMQSYDPYVAPDPEAWLALDDQAQIALIRRYHRTVGEITGNVVLHATVHMIVETQIALNDPPEVAQKMRSLIAEGLDRHEAVHALSTAVADMIWGMTNANKQSGNPVRRYVSAVRKLTAKKWLQMG